MKRYPTYDAKPGHIKNLRGVPYEVVDIEQLPDARRYVLRLAGINAEAEPRWEWVGRGLSGNAKPTPISTRAADRAAALREARDRAVEEVAAALADDRWHHYGRRWELLAGGRSLVVKVEAGGAVGISFDIAGPADRMLPLALSLADAARPEDGR